MKQRSHSKHLFKRAFSSKAGPRSSASFELPALRLLCLSAIASWLTPRWDAVADERRVQALAQALVTKGRLEVGIVACAACHRAQGQGDAGSGFGDLTGQTRDYLAKQLHDFQSGSREHRVMEVVVRSLTTEDIQALSSYYEELKPTGKASAIPEAPPAGGALAETGDRARDIPPCNSCHMPDGPRASYIPNLKGQHAIYLVNQLINWQTGARKNDPGQVMAAISKKLTPEEISAVAIYYARLPRTKR